MIEEKFEEEKQKEEQNKVKMSLKKAKVMVTRGCIHMYTFTAFLTM